MQHLMNYFLLDGYLEVFDKTIEGSMPSVANDNVKNINGDYQRGIKFGGED